MSKVKCQWRYCQHNSLTWDTFSGDPEEYGFCKKEEIELEGVELELEQELEADELEFLNCKSFKFKDYANSIESIVDHVVKTKPLDWQRIPKLKEPK